MKPTPALARAAALVAAMVVVALAAGCKGAERRRPRVVGPEVLGPATRQTILDAYRTPAFVARRIDGNAHLAVQDTDLAPDATVDDSNLIVFVEGAGDTVEGFRTTARLLAESQYGFRGAGPALMVVYLKWCQSTSPVAEHMNRPAQEDGAARLAEMLQVHNRRHGQRGRVSIVGFSAGTRVIEIAFSAAAGDDAQWHPEAFRRVENVVFLGSSVGCEERMPLAGVRGRFLNFVNPRDTHFGDRAAYVAPAGTFANPLKLIHQATVQRRPRFGASAAGFRDLPTLTAADQFDAIDAAERAMPNATLMRAFRMVNVPVPRALVAYNLFGDPVLDDDLDDYLNEARNHYILVGRGGGGRTDGPDFKQYRASAEEFVREHVAAAAMHGRLYRFDLKAVPKGANPLGLPLPVPWAIFGPPQEQPPSQPAPPGGDQPKTLPGANTEPPSK